MRASEGRQSGLKIFSLFDFGGRTTEASERDAHALHLEGTAVNGRRPIPVRPRPSFQGTEILCSPLKSVTQSEKGMESIPARPLARVNK